MPCICYNNGQWTNLTAEEIVDILVKNLTIDASSTTLALSKKLCRSDPRVSSANIGRIACAILISVLCILVCIDCTRLCRYRKRIHKKRSKDRMVSLTSLDTD